MHMALFVLGLLVAAAGFVTIGFGIPNYAFGFGNTLIIGGTVAVACGLILIGIAMAVRQLPHRHCNADQDEAASDRNSAANNQGVSEAECVVRNSKSDGHKAGCRDQQPENKQSHMHRAPSPTLTRA